jgi:hypothetical protein
MQEAAWNARLYEVSVGQSLRCLQQRSGMAEAGDDVGCSRITNQALPAPPLAAAETRRNGGELREPRPRGQTLKPEHKYGRSFLLRGCASLITSE